MFNVLDCTCKYGTIDTMQVRAIQKLVTAGHSNKLHASALSHRSESSCGESMHCLFGMAGKHHCIQAASR